MSERDDHRKKSEDEAENIAPDAVKDPNVKTEGKPGLGPKGGGSQNGETDPGSS